MKLSDLGPVVLVGAGKMGTAMARGWLAAGLRADRLILVDPKPSDPVIDFAGQHGLLLIGEMPDLAPRVLVLAVKPQIMRDVLADLAPRVGDETLVLSIAAGISLETLKSDLGTQRVVRMMPNTPAQVGKGMTGAVPAEGVNAEDRDITAALLAASGKVAWFDEEAKLDSLTAVSGSGPAYVFYMVEALAAAGVAEGLDPEQAMELARQTIIGAAALMDADPTDAGTLRENVTSPKGVTADALAVLMADDGLAPLMARAVKAARKRSEELGK
ncbi:pyrroline-5-carboxylate reductase [Mariluticola halotolerans]|uniref:pyrroline-5-carboxylate reductase n=1 Tax=Mariluticola halotolerans TaxID=2909283 RepID=UPI0026E228CA|nr:pyrroline-5-carboxylate reductase [Mariluticola halotolerans]UJQ94432.1 pyrroline-5-carboxylate reductase [Mariluticola halotolerans]